MQDQGWRTLFEIRVVTGDPEASISARLRDFRKDDFGAHKMTGRRRKDFGNLWEFQVILRGSQQQQELAL